jgi:salicylate biosynthesis isochorismate synthase/menaquinone-specific isochorismate synthase
VFDGLRTAFPGCFCFCAGTPDVAFIGASPELLVRREGATLSTVALAGSTRRSADPAVDDHLGQRLLQSDKDREEHRIVARRIERMLEPLAVWVASAEEPSLAKVENIQHLATPIRAQLAEPRGAVELAGVLHPTPAVGGEPSSNACELIEELEELDRGWYAAPVGWADAADDGEFCVALRCALLEGRTAHCYAGSGVVSNSEPEAELAESEVKLQTLLAVLTGS